MRPNREYAPWVQSGRGTLPTGVVTFLLTDIESSTPLWERDATAMSRALQLHDATIDEAVTAAGGRMLKARGEGDSTFSVFTRPTEAVRAAVAARRALETGDWPPGSRLAVRFAIHVGEVESRDGEYYGTAVNRAARIRGIAAGGQILVSQAVAEVVIDHLPEGVSLAELGEQELRGLSPARADLRGRRCQSPDPRSDRGPVPLQRTACLPTRG